MPSLEELEKLQKRYEIRDSYGARPEINRQETEEFGMRANDRIAELQKSDKKLVWINNINDYTVEDMKILKDSGQKVVFFKESEEKEFTIMNAYTPDDMMMIKEHYEKYYGPIRDNTNLTQKEKFHAAMMVFGSLTTYDKEAYRPNESTKYSEAAIKTSRDQYSNVKYGQSICVGYQDSVKKICDMLGVECKRMDGLSGMNVYNSFSKEQQMDLINKMKNGEKITSPYVNHAVNQITFDDGSTHLLDMTDHDGANEYAMKNDKRDEYDSKCYYMTDSKNFRAILQYNDNLIVEKPEDRDVSKCTVMPREEIKQAQEKAMAELPYINDLTQLDEIQQITQLSKSDTSRAFKFRENIKKFFVNVKERFNSNKTKALPEGREFENDNNNLQKGTEQNQGANFRAELSNNGKYRQDLENYMQNEFLARQNEQEKAIENDGLER